MQRIVLVAGNQVTGSRPIDIFRNAQGEAMVCVILILLTSGIRHELWAGLVGLERSIVIRVVPPQQILFIGDGRKPRWIVRPLARW